MKSIESVELLKKIIQEEDASLFYFSHDQCNVCKVLKPKVIDLIINRFQKIQTYYCNIQKSPKISALNSVFVAPTILIFFGGMETIRTSRNISIDQLAEQINRPYQLLFS